jgi:[ribosomal protein S5]-alanine N-acetyltransferase
VIAGNDHTETPVGPDVEASADEQASVEALGNPTAFRIAHPISTDRLRLRIFEESDGDALLTVIGDEVAMRLAGGARDSIRNLSELRAMRQSVLERGWGTLAIEFRGECVGYCGVRPMVNTPEVELAYGVHRSLWGQGIATEAASAVLNRAFQCLPIGSVVASVYPTNAASIRVLEKLGMKFEKQVFGIWPYHTAFHFRVTKKQFQDNKRG